MHPYLNSDNAKVFRLLGKASRKLQHYKEALQYFHEGLHDNDNESIYMYGKMLYLGEGISRDEKGAEEYFKIIRQNGYNKQFKFLQKIKVQETHESPILPEQESHEIKSLKSNQINNELPILLSDSQSQQILELWIVNVKPQKADSQYTNGNSSSL